MTKTRYWHDTINDEYIWIHVEPRDLAREAIPDWDWWETRGGIWDVDVKSTLNGRRHEVSVWAEHNDDWAVTELLLRRT